MKILAETHSHSLVSAHAYSTIAEMMSFAKNKGLEAVAITDHGPAVTDGAHIWHFGNLRVMPRIIDGVLLLKGAEVNIIDSEANLDIPDYYLKALDIVIASFHEPSFPPSTFEEHTNIWLKIAQNPLIDIIGHSGSDNYKFDYEKAILEFKKYDKAVELNNHSFRSRPGSEINCLEIAKICKKTGTKVVLSSDAHCCYDICNLEKIYALVNEIEFPEELIMNTTSEKLINWLEEKKGIKII